MATQLDNYPPDDMATLKNKRESIAQKIEQLEKQILELKEKDSLVAKKIFEREDGRILKAAKLAMAKDPDVKASIDKFLAALDIGGNTPLAKRRGRPPAVRQ